MPFLLQKETFNDMQTALLIQREFKLALFGDLRYDHYYIRKVQKGLLIKPCKYRDNKPQFFHSYSIEVYAVYEIPTDMYDRKVTDILEEIKKGTLNVLLSYKMDYNYITTKEQETKKNIRTATKLLHTKQGEGTKEVTISTEQQSPNTVENIDETSDYYKYNMALSELDEAVSKLKRSYKIPVKYHKNTSEKIGDVEVGQQVYAYEETLGKRMPTILQYACRIIEINKEVGYITLQRELPLYSKAVMRDKVATYTFREMLETAVAPIKDRVELDKEQGRDEKPIHKVMEHLVENIGKYLEQDIIPFEAVEPFSVRLLLAYYLESSLPPSFRRGHKKSTP